MQNWTWDIGISDKTGGNRTGGREGVTHIGRNRGRDIGRDI